MTERTFDFDTVIDRSRTESEKWDKYRGRDVIPSPALLLLRSVAAQDRDRKNRQTFKLCRSVIVSTNQSCQECYR